MADPLRRGVEGVEPGLALVKYVINAYGEDGMESTFGFQIPLRG